MRSGWPYFRRLSSEGAQPFSPVVVNKRGRLRPADEAAAFCVLVDKEGECLAWWPGGSLTSREVAYTVRLTSPLRLGVARPEGEGGE
jgi:hypothetical protein